MIKQEIKKLLHHREPYLMVDSVESIDEKEVISNKIFGANDFFIDGHFPGAPLVPGAMIQEFCTQSAGILITKFYSPVSDYDSEKTQGWALGVLNKVQSAKFLDVVKPGAEIQAKVTLVDQHENLFKFSAKVTQGGKLKAKMSFNLINVSDEVIK